MPSPTTFRRGSDFRAYVQESLAAKQASASRSSAPWGRLLDVSKLAAMATNWRLSFALEPAGLFLKQRAKKWIPVFPAVAVEGPPPARAEKSSQDSAPPPVMEKPPAKGGDTQSSRPALEERRREFESVRDRLDALSDPAAALEQWAADLAREYFQDFRPRPAEPKHAPPPAAEQKTFADAAVEAAFFAGREAWRVGKFLKPAADFALAHNGPILKVAAVCLTLIGAGSFLAQWPQSEPAGDFSPPSAAAPAAQHPRAAWVDIAKPYRFYELAAPQFARQKFTYAARRHTSGGGREDVLTFGEFSGKGPFLRLSVYRHGTEKTADAPFFVDMARRAAPLGLGLGRAAFAENQATRFGDFETASMTMAEGKVTRDDCRGFRLAVAEPGLSIAGFACGAGEPIGATDFACLVNRLDLLAAGDDRPLRDFFAAAQASGNRGCSQSGPTRKK